MGLERTLLPGPLHTREATPWGVPQGARPKRGIIHMAYKPVQNESAHLTDKSNRSAYERKKAKKKGTQSPAMKTNERYERSKKTRS